MNLFSHFRGIVLEALHALQQEGVLSADTDFSRVSVDPPREVSHGDMATNAAMLLAKKAGRKPRELAEKIAEKLTAMNLFMDVSIAGPGFINLTMANAFWQKQLPALILAGRAYGDSMIGEGQKVNIEYVSANPTGPMHVGHTRGAVFGDALASLLEKTGHKVCREYYINDAGGQIDILARSAFLRYREALGENIGEIPQGLYPGEYLKPVGEALAREYGATLKDRKEADWLPVVKRMATDMMMERIRSDLLALGIRHDHFFSESVLHNSGEIDKTLRLLDEKGLIHVGVLEPPKGKGGEGWEPRPQTLFRSTAFGDDTDRALKKPDGSWTYFAPDMAYHLNKFERGFRQLVNVWGADHAGYVRRMESAVHALTQGEATLDVKICQLVRLFRNGKAVRMSKRAGDFITLRELVEEVGRDGVRFMMLYRKNDAPLDFDYEKVKEQSRDNPVFYVQYAHARICSVLRNAVHPVDGVPGLDIADARLAEAETERLEDEAEIALVRILLQFPRILETAAQAHEPHRIAFYLHELASVFHGLWNKGLNDRHLRFIVYDNKKLTLARIALIRAAANVIVAGLDILGVEPVEEMH